MHTQYEVRRWTSPSRKGNLTISKSKSSCLSKILVETVQLDIHRFKSKQRRLGIGKNDFILLEFSRVYAVHHLVKVNIVNI